MTRCFRWALSAALLALLAACAGPALPPPVWLRLPADASPPVELGPPNSQVWQLVGVVSLPGHLDRDVLLLPSGEAGVQLQPRAGARWAEPLRDAVPRLLRHDLSRALGAPLWSSPLPPGVVPTRQLRVELIAFDLQPGLRSISVLARYSVTSAGLAPRAGEIAFQQALTADDSESLVRGHRAALAVLAQNLAKAVR